MLFIISNVYKLISTHWIIKFSLQSFRNLSLNIKVGVLHYIQLKPNALVYTHIDIDIDIDSDTDINMTLRPCYYVS